MYYSKEKPKKGRSIGRKREENTFKNSNGPMLFLPAIYDDKKEDRRRQTRNHGAGRKAKPAPQETRRKAAVTEQPMNQGDRDTFLGSPQPERETRPATPEIHGSSFAACSPMRCGQS